MMRYYETTAGEGFIIDINENKKNIFYKSGEKNGGKWYYSTRSFIR